MARMDWLQCPAFEAVPGRLSGVPVIRHSRVRPEDLIVNRDQGAAWLARNHGLPQRRRHSRRCREVGTELVRSLVDHVALHPKDKGQRVEVRGKLAAILGLAGGEKANGAKGLGASDAVALSQQMKMVAGTRNTRSRRSGTSVPGIGVSQELLVAGAGFEPAAFRL